jgi:photosystem II stability/assembly factor-like uncharacterized protein
VALTVAGIGRTGRPLATGANMTASHGYTIALIAALAAASPAAAQWTRVDQVPNTELFNVWANGDTIATGAASTVFVSTDRGGTWRGSTTVTQDPLDIERVRIRNGRLYAATRRQGVFVSDDLGSTWASFNQGLVGGFGNSQLDIIDMLVRGDSLYVATEGSGAWVRNLRGGTWSRFGNVFEPEQAANMTFIASGGSRLLAGGGFNGELFFRDPGQPDWTPTLLFNDRFAPGLASTSAIWTGTRWVVGSNIGVFLSASGESPWTFVDPGAGRPLFGVPFALHGHDLFASFSASNSTLALSRDDGSTWQLIETLPLPITGLAFVGSTLYVSRFDGLFRRSLDDIPTVSVPPRDPRLRFAIAGRQPVRDLVRFQLYLPVPGRAVIQVFDVAGRHVASPVDATYSAGPNEIAWNAQALSPGVYHARLSVGPRTETLRFVRVP